MIILCYLAIYLIWGSTYFFIAGAVETIPPSWILTIRWTAGGLFFLTLSLIRSKGHISVTKKNLLSSMLIGFLLLIGGNGLVTIAEKTIDSYVAALMISTVPMVVSLFNFIFFRLRISLLKISGVVLGFSGVAFLLYNGEQASFEFSPAVFLIFTGVCSWALGTSLGAKLDVSPDIFANSAIQMLTAGLFSAAPALITTNDLSGLFATFSPYSVFSLIYLVIFGSLAIGAFNYLMRREPSIRLTSYALVNPLIATSLGIFFGGESIRRYLFAGLPMILAGLFLMLYGDRLSLKLRGKPNESASANE